MVNGKVFGDFSSGEYGLEKIEENRSWERLGKYAEMSNDKIVLKRDYDGRSITGKTEQEIFENIDKTPPSYEVIVLGNLALRIWKEKHYQLNELSGIGVYKNDEEIGDLSLRNYYNYKEGYKSSGYCTTGQCQVMFKELIDKSFYKDKIYSALESAKPKE